VKPLPTEQTQETNINAFSGIQPRDPSNRAAADGTVSGIDGTEFLLFR